MCFLETWKPAPSQKKWNELGFRPPLCTYRLKWARRTSWGWWDDWNDTVLQTQDSKFESWRSKAEHATSRSRKLSTIQSFTRGWGRNILVSFKRRRPGTEPRTQAWKTAVLTTTPANTRRWPNAGLLLAHRLRRWTNNSPALGQRIVFAGDPRAPAQRPHELSNIQHRLAVTQLRTRNHKLHVETCSWCKPRPTPFDERLCFICDRDELEDEFHFVLCFPAYTALRLKYIKKYYYQYPSMYKFTKLLTIENKIVLRKLAAYVYYAFKKRNEIAYINDWNIPIHCFTVLFYLYFDRRCICL